MRRLVIAASLALLATGAGAQPSNPLFQLNTDTANITAAKSKFKLTAGVLQWNAAKPEASTFALSLDATSLDNDAMKTQLDTAHFPEIRVLTTGPGRKSGDKISMPIEVTIHEIPKAVTLQMSLKNSGRQVDMHAEGTLRASDFKLKGSDIPLVVDASFKPATGQ